MSDFRLPPQTRPGAVALTVASLERMIPFYEQVIGLRVRRREPGRAVLGVDGADLLHLIENPHGRRVRGVTGLYHFALLLPSRRELARAVARLFDLRYPSAPTDHIMTKTTYLDDPEGNGIELYCESPEDGEFVIEGGRFYARRADGSWSDGREPLDLEALFAHLQPGDDLHAPMPTETRIGHVHLHVADLDASRRFYCEILGFDDRGLTRDFRMGMVSVGGYHHHIGYNTWQGEGAPPPPADALGLHWFSLRLPDEAALQALEAHLRVLKVPVRRDDHVLWLQDPSANTLRITLHNGGV